MNIKWENKSVLKLLDLSSENDPLVMISELARKLIICAFDEGWSGPPFDPIKLAKLLNHSVMPNEAIIDARILSENNRFIIEYNPHWKNRSK